MTLPWFLNPWAEVRRLRSVLANERYRNEGNRNVMRRTVQFYRNKNADLRRRIAEVEKWVPHDPASFKIPSYQDFMRDCQDSFLRKETIDFSRLKNMGNKP